jgi:hypothetical protein
MGEDQRGSRTAPDSACRRSVRQSHEDTPAAAVRGQFGACPAGRARAPAPPGSRRPAALHGLLVVMQAQRAPYVPSSLEIVRIPGGAVLRIGYPVPSPLGLLRSGG